MSGQFLESAEEEPHSSRRKLILERYPEIRQLMKHEPRTKYMVAATVLAQLCLARASSDMSMVPYVVCSYVVGATLTHSLFLAIHEMAHNLAFQAPTLNKALSIFANIPIGFPYCATFRVFHMHHHTCQGHDGVDTDIPTRAEGHLIASHSYGYPDRVVRKFLFVFFQIFAYALRPPCVNPTGLVCSGYVASNVVVQVAASAAIALTCPAKMVGFLLLSTFWAGGMHPLAGHFIAEHYTNDAAHETFSYYGVLNYVSYNVGYHNEHHDFPTIPWSGLPKVRAMAPEFYDTLPRCECWVAAIYNYVVDDRLGPYSRVTRHRLKET